MGSFRRVEGEEAGPDALGILIPPGRRTFVILRPRGLPCDLLLCRGGDDLTFRDLAHDEASAVAQALYRALRDWAAGGPGLIEVIPRPENLCIRAHIGTFTLIACTRLPGQPYTPQTWSHEAAHEAADRLRAVLCPPGTVEQELYFNVRFFERPTG